MRNFSSAERRWAAAALTIEGSVASMDVIAAIGVYGCRVTASAEWLTTAIMVVAPVTKPTEGRATQCEPESGASSESTQNSC